MTSRRDTLPSAMWRALRLVWRSSPRLTLANLLLTPLLAVLPPLALYLLKRVVDATAEIWAAGARTALSDWRPLSGLILCAGVLLVAGIFVRAALAWFGQALQFVVDDRVRGELHARLLSFDIEFFENHERLNHLFLARDQALQRPMHMVNGLLQLMRGITSAAGILALLGAFRWWLPPMLLAGAMPGVALRLRRARKFYLLRKEFAPLEREASYFDRVLSGGGQMKELRVYGHGSYFRERFQSLRRQVRAAQLRWRLFVLGGGVMAQLVGLAVVAAALALLARDLLAGVATLGALAMCVQGINRGHGALSGVVGGLISLYEDALFLQGYEELMAHPVAIVAPARPRPVPPRLREGITFEHVSFSYPGASKLVLDDVSFTLRPGESLALVGGNGSGKSTLVKLLCRLYDPTAGAIRADGVDLREFDPASWRKVLGVLFQDFGAYPLTARENVWFGNMAGDAAGPEIAAAALRAGADSLVNGLPRGWETRLGRAFADSVELSFGQWQRLALARAFARDSALFIMDEPTSALDGQAQRVLMARLDDWKRGRGVLLVSHDPAAVRSADRVIVLVSGRVAEQGTPGLLAAAGGVYASLLGSG